MLRRSRVASVEGLRLLRIATRIHAECWPLYTKSYGQEQRQRKRFIFGYSNWVIDQILLAVLDTYGKHARNGGLISKVEENCI